MTRLIVLACLLMVHIPAMADVTASVDADVTKWSVPIELIRVGECFNIEAVDKAGNVSEPVRYCLTEADAVAYWLNHISDDYDCKPKPKKYGCFVRCHTGGSI